MEKLSLLERSQEPSCSKHGKYIKKKEKIKNSEERKTKLTLEKIKKEKVIHLIFLLRNARKAPTYSIFIKSWQSKV